MNHHFLQILSCDLTGYQRKGESQGKRQTLGMRHEKGGNVSYAITDSLDRLYLPYATGRDGL